MQNFIKHSTSAHLGSEEDSDVNNNRFMLYLGIVIVGVALVVIAAACVVGVVILWKSKNSENSYGDEYEGEHSMAALKFSEIEFDTDESISLNNRYKIYPPEYSPPHMREKYS